MFGPVPGSLSSGGASVLMMENGEVRASDNRSPGQVTTHCTRNGSRLEGSISAAHHADWVFSGIRGLTSCCTSLLMENHT